MAGPGHGGLRRLTTRPPLDARPTWPRPPTAPVGPRRRRSEAGHEAAGSTPGHQRAVGILRNEGALGSTPPPRDDPRSSASGPDDRQRRAVVRVVVAPDKVASTASAARGGRGRGAPPAWRPAGSAVSAEWPTGAKRPSTCWAAQPSTMVTGPLGEPVAAAWRLDGRNAVVEMGDERRGFAGGRGRSQRSDRRVRGRDRRAGVGRRRRRGPAGPRRPGRLGHHRRRAGNAAVRCTRCRLAGVEIVALCDVRTSFVDAAEVFAPQETGAGRAAAAPAGAPGGRLPERCRHWTCTLLGGGRGGRPRRRAGGGGSRAAPGLRRRGRRGGPVRPGGGGEPGGDGRGFPGRAVVRWPARW